MTFSFIETPFSESSQLIALPVILYILKDNESVKTLCSNSNLNMAILLASVFISKTNFQASVYLMLTFIMLHLLGNCSDSHSHKAIEEFKPLNESEDFQEAEVSQLMNYDLKGNESQVSPMSSNQYMIPNNSAIVEENTSMLNNEQEVSNEPVPQSSEMNEIMGFSDDLDNFESF